MMALSVLYSCQAEALATAEPPFQNASKEQINGLDVLQSEGGGGNSLWLSAVENGMGAANNEGIYIKNNVFYLSRYALITLLDYLAVDYTTPVNAPPVFSGNTYVQFASRLLLQKNWSSEVYYPTEEVVRNILGDETGTLVTVGR